MQRAVVTPEWTRLSRIRTARSLSRPTRAVPSILAAADVVLVIEDNPRLLTTLGEALSTEVTAPILATALQALREMQRGTVPAVIVIDLDIPDGFDVLTRVECAAPDFLPVVALSSSPMRLLGASVADEIVMKPFEVGYLRRCVERACEQPRGAL